MSKQASFTDLDIRVRARNLKAGLITDKDVEKHVAGLEDVEAASEGFATPQPLFADAEDDIDDEDDLDDEEESEPAEAPKPEASNGAS